MGYSENEIILAKAKVLPISKIVFNYSLLNLLGNVITVSEISDEFSQ